MIGEKVAKRRQEAMLAGKRGVLEREGKTQAGFSYIVWPRL